MYGADEMEFGLIRSLLAILFEVLKKLRVPVVVDALKIRAVCREESFILAGQFSRRFDHVVADARELLNKLFQHVAL